MHGLKTIRKLNERAQAQHDRGAAIAAHIREAVANMTPEERATLIAGGERPARLSE